MITFCIPTKNNLRYLKNAITSILTNQHYDNEIAVFVDASDDGTLEWIDHQIVDSATRGVSFPIKVSINELDSPKGIAYGYNRCIEIASNDVVCMFHADMYMGECFDINIMKHIKKGTVVAGTRIEPPLHPEGRDKIVRDFGMYPEDFKKKEFDLFVSQCQIDYEDHITHGIFAPWACYKSDIKSIVMHDENFHSYHEDTDIFNRFILNGMDIIQSWDALVYHLTCRGGQFQDGIESVTTDDKFHKMKKRAALEFIRKWGTFIHNDEYGLPIVYPRYDTALAISNVPNTEQARGIIEQMEPWFCNVYLDSDVVSKSLVDKLNGTSKFDMETKFKPYSDDFSNDITLIADFSELTQSQQTFSMAAEVIQNLPLIIMETPEDGYYEYGPFHISIKDFNRTEKNLITNI